MNDQRRATLKDVAEKAGVSIATISRFVHGLPVSSRARAKVEAALRVTQYVPNLAARSLKTNSSQIIACSIRSMMRTALVPLLSSIEKSTRDARYTLVLSVTEEDLESQRTALRLLASRGLDGLIFSGAPDQGEELTDALRALNVPVVLVDRDPTAEFDAVNVAHAHSTEISVRHLRSLGHEKICLLTPPNESLPGRERLVGYRRGLRQCGMKYRADHVSDKCVDEDSTLQQTYHMLSLPDAPTAVIAGGMSILPSVMRVARQLRLQIGRDLSVIAGCDTELSELSTPGITATRWDMTAWGRVATEMLVARLQDPAMQGPGRHVVIPTELVVRGSTCSPATRKKK